MTTLWHVLLPAFGDPELMFLKFSFSWSPLGKADLLISLAAPTHVGLWVSRPAWSFHLLDAICFISSKNEKSFKVPGLPKAPFPVSGAATGTHYLFKRSPMTFVGFGEGGRGDDG